VAGDGTCRLWTGFPRIEVEWRRYPGADWTADESKWPTYGEFDRHCEDQYDVDCRSLRDSALELCDPDVVGGRYLIFYNHGDTQGLEALIGIDSADGAMELTILEMPGPARVWRRSPS
jgi:hypothetical protein